MKFISSSVVILILASVAASQEPRLIAEPGAFRTLVNPQCSHCRDEAKRRASDLRTEDRVLCWIRGYSDGGVIPHRFFLNPYRVISDTYGVFVYDPDAGYARGFAPSLDFTFHGWRNGVMVMKHKDGTLYSCLTGIAFDGPKKGEKLKAVPTLVNDWGHWLEKYPQSVAYNMFDKYQPVELPGKPNESSVKSRGKTDVRMPAEFSVFGIADGKDARAYPITVISDSCLLQDTIGGKPCAIFWHHPTQSAAAYRPIASPPKNVKSTARVVTLEPHRKHRYSVGDKETGSEWDIAGRAVDGPLKGWTLEWLDGVEVKWFAWAAEYPHTTIFDAKKKEEKKPSAKNAIEQIAGTAEFLRAVPKKVGSLRSVDHDQGQVTIQFKGDREPTTWTLTPDAEIKIHGWWGRLDDFPLKAKAGSPFHPDVWVWFKVDRAQKPVAIFMLADELSEQDIHGDGYTVKEVSDKAIVLTFGKNSTRELPPAGFFGRMRDGKRTYEKMIPLKDQVFVHVHAEVDGTRKYDLLDRATLEAYRTVQKNLQRQRWLKEGLPGAVGFLHVYAGEVDVILDHEAMRWGRSLTPGAKVELDAKPPIKAVVKSVQAQREKTQVRLVVKSIDLADLKMGQRVHLKMPAPNAEVENAVMPPGSEVPKTKEERIDWFLANTYCCCKVGGDGCTGHFYTLASCNPNACAAPNQTRKFIAKKIDDGWTNREIFDAMLKERGPVMLRPHLLP